MLGAIIAILYVPAGMQRLLLVNLTLFQWAGGGEGGGQSAQNQNLLFFNIYFYVTASIMCICLSACIHVIVGFVHPTPYL